MTAENGKLDEIPPRSFQKLPLPAEVVDAAGSLMTVSAESDHEHFVLGDALVVDVNDVMLLLSRSAAYAIRKLLRDPVAIAALCGVH
jgi:hypothetical protein